METGVCLILMFATKFAHKITYNFPFIV